MIQPSKLDFTILNELKKCNILNSNILSMYKFDNYTIVIINNVDNYLKKQCYKFSDFITKNDSSIVLKYFNSIYSKFFIVKIILNSMLNKRICRNYEYINSLNLNYILKYEIVKFNNVVVLISKFYNNDLYSYLSKKKWNMTKSYIKNIIIKNLISSLASLHKNKIIHGDIKAKNVLITEVNKFCFKKIDVALCDLDYSRTKYNIYLYSITTCNCPYYIINQYDYNLKDDVFCLGLLIAYILDKNLYETIFDLHNLARSNIEIYEYNLGYTTCIAIEKSNIKQKYKKILEKMLEPKYDLRISMNKLVTDLKYHL